MMNYGPNTTYWNIGDLVLTKYIQTHTNGHYQKSVRKVWRNRLEVLHDPRRFGVTE